MAKKLNQPAFGEVRQERHQGLLIVDVQNDFCPGGALAVPQGEAVVPVLNKYIKTFSQRKIPIFASRDWHPQQTKHFKDLGGPWPTHCVQETQGAAFHPGLRLPLETTIISKGMEADKDSYSAFQGVDNKGNAFLNRLNKLGIKELFIGGLATDYCVKSSVLDALRHFTVYLLVDAIKGVNIKPDDSQKAIAQMLKAGAREVTFADLTRNG